MYEIAVVVARVPQKGEGKYRRPVHIRVYNPDVQPTEYARLGKGQRVRAIREWTNVDSRFTGPRSAFGRAMREAEELVATLERGDF